MEKTKTGCGSPAVCRSSCSNHCDLAVMGVVQVHFRCPLLFLTPYFINAIVKARRVLSGSRVRYCFRSISNLADIHQQLDGRRTEFDSDGRSEIALCHERLHNAGPHSTELRVANATVFRQTQIFRRDLRSINTTRRDSSTGRSPARQ